MKTPVHFTELVDHGILTTEIIASVIYSFNKRAKNYKEHDNAGYKRAKMARNLNLLGVSEPNSDVRGKNRAIDYYRKKDFVLISLFQPEKMHIIDGVEYLCFNVHKSVFHFPRYIYELYGFQPPQNLEVAEVLDFQACGEPVEHLLSVRFCDKVVDLIKSENFILIEGRSAKLDTVRMKKMIKISKLWKKTAPALDDHQY